MKKILLLLSLLQLSSCGLILINENNYRALKDSNKKTIKDFDYESAVQSGKRDEDVLVYEINSNDIKQYLKNHKYTWIHLWRPFCKSESCLNINMYSGIENDFKNKGLSLLFISETYDIESINQRVRNTNFEKPIFVLQDSYYGHKIRKNRVKLFNDFNQSQLPKTKYGYDDLLFKDTSLIYASYQLKKNEIDSVLMALER